MTRVDFYILKEADEKARPLFACKLADKVYHLGQRVFIHTASDAQSRMLDDLLWTFKQNSFLPHNLYEAGQADPPPILVGHDSEPDQNTDVLINLAPDVPLFFSRFERVAEVIDGNDTRKTEGRERYRFYRERGYELQSHNL